MRIDGIFGSTDPRHNSAATNRIGLHVNVPTDLSEPTGRRVLFGDRFTDVDNSELRCESSTSSEMISMEYVLSS